MTDRVIPITEQRQGVLPMPAAEPLGQDPLVDRWKRPLHDLRISVTDRCNFRCTYCMPKEVFDADYPFMPRSEMLRFEEIERLARLFISLGVRKIRLTGGEPLLRRGLEDLIARLAELKSPDGEPIDLTLTTNGSLLTRKAALLAQAGLKRVTVSLDGLDDAAFRRMNDVDFPVRAVLDGIEAASAAGLGPIKINMVVKKGCNDDQILPMVRYFKDTGHILRFIEFMDVGSSNGWNMAEVLPSAQVIERIASEFALEPLEANYRGEVAERWRLAGGGELGVISSVTQAFCRDCTRARLSTEGRLYLCLFAHAGFDLRELIREGHSDEAILQRLAGIWRQRSDRYSELRSELSAGRPKIEMSYIGG